MPARGMNTPITAFLSALGLEKLGQLGSPAMQKLTVTNIRICGDMLGEHRAGEGAAGFA